MLLSILIERIKKKTSLKNLDDSIIKEKINNYLKKNSLEGKNLDKKHLQYLIKEIRRELHEGYGVYQLNLKKRQKYFNQLRLKPNSLYLHNKILATHKSSKERIEIYPILYKTLFKITSKPSSILDLAAGLNPFSFPYMKLKKIKYIASELTKEDCNLLQEYFSLKKKIKGRVLQIDLLKAKRFPKADITFIFKTFHSLEKNSFRLAESILKRLNSKFIIVSFPILTISNKKMNFPYFPGFERMLKRTKLRYKKLLLKNELFYIIEKEVRTNTSGYNN